MRLMIDAHLDLSWNALSFNRDLTQTVDAINEAERGMSDHPCRGKATLSLPELRKAGIAVCLGTILTRCNPAVAAVMRTDLDHRDFAITRAVGQGQLAYYKVLAERGEIAFIKDVQTLNAHWAKCEIGGMQGSPIGLILSMEGTDPILSADDAARWWEEGLRAAGLCHYGQSAHAVGTGFNGPVSQAGFEMLKAFEQLGMILDVTHLSDQSFDEALDHFDGAVLASHSNCRALVPDERQFNDEQLKRLIERGAVIGSALDAWMLYTGWEHGKTSPDVVGLEAVVDHIDHVCQLAGNCKHAAIGSDLDGGFGTEQTPRDLKRITDLQKLDGLLKDRGYSDADIDAIFHGNWLRFFREHLPE